MNLKKSACLLLLTGFGCGADPAAPPLRLLDLSEQMTLQSDAADWTPVVRKATLRLDSRDCLAAPPNSSFSLDVPVFGGAQLIFGYAAPKLNQGLVVLSVEVSTGSESTTVFEETFSSDQESPAPGWREARVDLSSRAGKTATLVFSARSTSPDFPEALWANPMIVYPRRPTDRNVILISIDTLRADRLNAYGYRERLTTPALDALARDGVRFERAFANSPWTTPSHMSLFTSLYPSAHGLNAPIRDKKRRLDPSVRTLAQILRNNGFVTAAFTADGAVAGKLGFWRGFDVYVETAPRQGEDLERVFSKAARWVNQNGEQRFFIFFHTYEVHLPNTHPFPGGPSAAQPTGHIELAQQGYDGDLRFTDQILGEFFDLLKKSDLYENSIIVLLSDHGENLYDRMADVFKPGHGFHLHDEMLLVPLIVTAPGLLPRTDAFIEEPAELIDVMPTLLSMLSVERNGVMQGRDLSPFFSNNSASGPGYVFAEATTYGPESKALRTKRFKLILTPDLSLDPLRRLDRTQPPWDWSALPRVQLFDLRGDPGETKNLAEELPQVVDRLKELMAQILRANETIRSGKTNQILAPDPELVERLRSLGYVE